MLRHELQIVENSCWGVDQGAWPRELPQQIRGHVIIVWFLCMVYQALMVFIIFCLDQGCQTESQEGQVSACFCGFLSISCQLRPADQGVSIL